nr:patatin-like phospholipase family protein [uncultured Roseateles sp.]
MSDDQAAQAAQAAQADNAAAALDSIAAMAAARRARLPPTDRPAPEQGLWGLALSGGGIRSATFCFGLLKALGQNKVFHRFDILSTVSGGGYIGSTVGKLFQNARDSGQNPIDVEAALGEADRRWFAFWLRANGRYLIPRGGRDLMFAGANFGRNLVGVHIELALMSLLLGGLLVGFDLLLWAWADCIFSGGSCWRPGWVNVDTLAALSNWPTLWLLLPPAIWWGAVQATAYWALPAKAGEGLSAQRWIIAVLSAAGAWWLADYWSDARDTAPSATAAQGLQLPSLLMLFAGGVLLAWVAGTLIAWWMTRRGRAPDLSRNQLTGGLAGTLNLGLSIAALGLVDGFAWLLANASAAHHGTAGVVIAVTVVVLRTVLPKIADLPRSLTPGTRMNLMGLINFAGLVVMALLMVFWISLLHRNVTVSLFDEQRRELQYALSWTWMAVLVLPPLVMVLVSLHNRDFLNRSSLFSFYRARLVRSYLGAANAKRFQPGTTDATAPYPRHLAAEGPQVAVQDVHPDDDEAMADYQPHLAGGPIHLLNACVNQTRDPRGGLFNQDRKGLLMTVGPRGSVRVGQDDWRAVDASGSLSLGSWVAISGAAVAPGLGGSTRSGMAALLTMAGIRLGYWWDSTALARRAGEMLPPIVGKYGQLLNELRGRFDGNQRRDWFLSDGGHFENTGAYALLREECKLIVVADCGADPRYAFGDLENLVRKARIDLQTEITFLKPKLGAASDPAMAPCVFGSLNDLVSPESHACLALARISYGRSGGIGHLVIVKPNMCQAVPVDLVNFKADNPLFPQEPTTDQFFSEAQWESYFQLGHTLGRQLDAGFLDQVQRHAEMLFEIDDGSVVTQDADGKAKSVAAPKRLPSRIAATGAVTASVSLGALATLGATAWQTVDTQLQAIEKAKKVDPGVLKELTDLYGKLAPSAAAASGVEATPKDTRLGEMATALLRISDAACTGDNTQAFKQSALMQMILNNTKKSCAEASPKHPACEVLLDDDEIVSCLREETRLSCVPRYWVRDYGAPDRTRLNCQPPVPPKPVVVAAAAPPAPPPPAATPDTPDTAGSGPDKLSMKPGKPVQVPAPAPAAPPLICAGMTVYIQIFGPELRDSVRSLRDRWRELGANVPPVEDVWDSARRAGRTPPQTPKRITVLHHDAAGKDCAEALQPPKAKTAWSVTELSQRLNGTPGVIEVWIPPLATANAAPPASAYCYQEDMGTAGSKRYGMHCHAEQAACESARGPNPKRQQSTCQATDLGNVGGQLTLRGWGGSWYALQAMPFEAPFPQLGK